MLNRYFISPKILFISTGKQRKQKKQKRSEEYYSSFSESDKDKSSKKRRSHHVSHDSDSESYDVSSGYDEEPTEGRHHKRSDVNESLSKKHSRLLERKRTKDSKLNHKVLKYYLFPQESSGNRRNQTDQKNFIPGVQSLVEISSRKQKGNVEYEGTIHFIFTCHRRRKR